MKKIVSIILFLMVSYDGFTQRTQIIDSLRHELVLAKDDTSKVLIKSELSFMLSFVNPDSSIIYAQDALTLARHIKYYMGQTRAFHSLGRGYVNIGDIPKALEMEFEGLQIAKEKKFRHETAMCLLEIGAIYQYIDLKKSIEYHNQAMQINESDQTNADYDYLKNRIYLNFGISYLQNNQLDSALVYLESTYYRTLTSAFFHAPLLLYYGQIQFKLGNQDEGINYLRQSIGISDRDKEYYTGTEAYTALAECYLIRNQPDSAIYCSKKGLEEAQAINYKRSILQNSSQLAKLYETRDINEAHKYLKIAYAVSEELHGPEKFMGLQKQISEEQERQRNIEAENIAYRNRIKQYFLIGILTISFLIAFILYRNNRQKQKANKVLETTLSNLKSTQSQLIQSEKMASLGELTAGIAHEIQNPLNFVNNFSEVNSELIDELNEEADKGNLDEVKAIAKDIKENEQKINHHGKRADAIVKGMLQHSLTSSGVKEPTDINALADEYLRLSYHGLRAKDKSFNADFKTEFDESLPKINVISQDIGRVLLNLINNAFYAVDKRAREATTQPSRNEFGTSSEGGAKNTRIEYWPTVTISTTSYKSPSGDLGVKLVVKDNGYGIPEKIKDKIFQPFFTTKPTGQGTGLGLSLSYDIIKAHGGMLTVETKEGDGLPAGQAGSEFIIQLPIKSN